MTNFIARVVSLVLFIAILWLVGLILFTFSVPTKTKAVTHNADAIVVLTGGKGRIEQGLRLLADGRAPVMFISGVGKETTAKDILAQLPRATLREVTPIKKNSIVLGKAAQNTIGNAEETLAWMEGQKIQCMFLVTSNYHMPRSLNEFSAVMTEVNIIPVAVLSDEFMLGEVFHNKASRSLLLSEYHKFIASFIRQWLVSLW